MAINTRDRRASCLAWNSPNRARVWTNPAAGELSTQAGRQHAAWVYEGILASAPVVIAYFTGLTTSRLLTGAGA
jgi:hypothetical protein